MSKKIITTVSLDAETVKIIDKWATLEDRSRSAVIRKILDAEIKRRQAKPAQAQAQAKPAQERQ